MRVSRFFSNHLKYSYPARTTTCTRPILQNHSNIIFRILDNGRERHTTKGEKKENGEVFRDFSRCASEALPSFLPFLPKRFKQRGIGGRSENFEHSETFGPMRGPCGAPAREVHTLALFFLPKITTTGVHNAPPQKVLGPKAIAPPEHSSERTSARGHFFDGAPTLLGISAPF